MRGWLSIIKKLQAVTVWKLAGDVDRLSRLARAYFLVGTVPYACILKICEISNTFSKLVVQFSMGHEHLWFTAPTKAQTDGITPLFTITLEYNKHSLQLLVVSKVFVSSADPAPDELVSVISLTISTGQLPILQIKTLMLSPRKPDLLQFRRGKPDLSLPIQVELTQTLNFHILTFTTLIPFPTNQILIVILLLGTPRSIKDRLH